MVIFFYVSILGRNESIVVGRYVSNFSSLEAVKTVIKKNVPSDETYRRGLRWQLHGLTRKKSDYLDTDYRPFLVTIKKNMTVIYETIISYQNNLP